MAKKKYYIVPRDSFVMINEAESPEDAMIDFATVMDSDMNTYFKAVTEEEYKDIFELSKRLDTAKADILDFMLNEVMSRFGLCEDAALPIAKNAHDMYMSGQGDLTQNKCIDEAVSKWKSSIETDLNSQLKDYDLEGVEITDVDVDDVIEMCKTMPLQDAIDATLEGIYETLHEEDDEEE